MNSFFNVTGGKGGNAFLIAGDNKTALIDCGMSYCASNLILNIKQLLKQKPLDYVLISHSHYDHVGGVPYLREEWPNIKVYGTEYDQKVLRKDTALHLIKELSIQAAEIYNEGNFKDYNNNLMKIDTIITNGSVINLGGMNIQVIETPGHTRHTLSFLLDNSILFASESTGYMSKSGKVYPAFLISYSETMSSIKLCQKVNPDIIISPHYGLLDKNKTETYWQECMASAIRSRNFIFSLLELGCSDAQILSEYENIFQDEESRLEQPIQAFRLNALGMIKTLRLCWNIHNEN